MKKMLCKIFLITDATHLIDPILEKSYNVLPGKVNLQPSKSHIIFTDHSVFRLFLHLKSYNFSMTVINVLYYIGDTYIEVKHLL